MAKVGANQKGWRGKAAGTVYAKGPNGSTIARELVIPTNPRTRKQMAQRMVFATVGSAAKLMKPLINHSFEGVKYGAKSVRRFQSLNVKRMRVFAAADFDHAATAANCQFLTTTKDISALIPNKYQVSAGSLSPSPVRIVVSDTNELMVSIPAASVDRAVHLPVTVGETEATVAVADLVRAIWGIGDGNDQLTVANIITTSPDFLYSYMGSTEAGLQIPYAELHASRLVVDPAFDFSATLKVANVAGGTPTVVSDLEAAIADLLTTTLFNNDKTAAVLADFFNNLLGAEISAAISGNATDGYQLDLTAAGDDITNFQLSSMYPQTGDGGPRVLAAAVIRSRFEGEQWRRSNSYMTICQPETGAYNNFGLLWSVGYDAWSRGLQIAEDERFLNEGSDDNQIGESFA